VTGCGPSPDLDERLEETVTELARGIGIGADTDEQVERSMRSTSGTR
jgi:hypothetical protein